MTGSVLTAPSRRSSEAVLSFLLVGTVLGSAVQRSTVQ